MQIIVMIIILQRFTVSVFISVHLHLPVTS